MRHRALAVNVGLAVTSVAVAGIGTELALRALLPPTTGYYVLIPNTDRTFHPQPAVTPGVEGPARYRVNQHGIRGREFGPDDREYRILAVGGSTTECAYLDEDEVWTALLERALGRTSDGRPVWVGNVGRSARTARDHVVQLKYLLPGYPRIDAAVVLVGVNDLISALADGAEYRRPAPIADSAAEQAQVRRAFVFVPGAIHHPGTDVLASAEAPWYKATALWQLAKRARMAHLARTNPRRQDARGTWLDDWRAARARGETVDALPPSFEDALAEYRATLLAMAAVTRAARVRLILVTQPSLWRPDNSAEELRRLWMGGIGDSRSAPPARYYSSRVLRLAMDGYNRQLMAVCDGGEDIICLDGASAVAPDTTMMYDDVHFTEAGARRLAAYLSDELQRRSPFR